MSVKIGFKKCLKKFLNPASALKKKKTEKKVSVEAPSMICACWCVPCSGDGADAALQPASDRGVEEQADTGENQTAKDSAQRRQDPHGHVQEEPSHHRSCHQPRAGEGEGQTGDQNMECRMLEMRLTIFLMSYI